MLDNASTTARSARRETIRSVDADLTGPAARQGRQRHGAAGRARGRYGLLLNEDSELLPGATDALREALEANPRAGAAGARLLRPRRAQPSRRVALSRAGDSTGLGALRAPLDDRAEPWRAYAARRLGAVRGACSSAARRPADQLVDSRFFVYSDEVDFSGAARRRLGALFVPAARRSHHEQLSTGSPERRIVEFSRNRDRYMRKHHSRIAALVRWLTAWAYAARALAAWCCPATPRRYARHATAAPGRGEGLREAADDPQPSEARRTIVKSHTVYRTFETSERREFVRITEDVQAAVDEAGVAEGMVLVSAMHITAGRLGERRRAGHPRGRARVARQAGAARAGSEPGQRRRPASCCRTTATTATTAAARTTATRTSRTCSCTTRSILPVTAGRLDLGPWQQVFYAEFDGGRPQAAGDQGARRLDGYP